MSTLKMILGENGLTMTIGDKVYDISPLTLGDIAEAEEKFGCDLEGFGEKLKKIKNLLFLVYLSLKRKQPDIKFSEIGEMFKLSDMQELNILLTNVLSVSGMVSEKNE